MPRTLLWLSLMLMAAASLLLAACGQRTTAPTSTPKPATLEKIPNSDLARVILSQEGARRIDLRTEPVGLRDGSPAAPYAAVVYDKSGATWVYTAPEPLTFVRHSVSVEAIRGDVALLKDGPPPGTPVVTVGVAELYGVEFGIGK
jgi:hypothetical protein